VLQEVVRDLEQMAKTQQWVPALLVPVAEAHQKQLQS
jgi:hypothetical protein